MSRTDIVYPLMGSGEIQGAYQIKVTTTALALLLATRHTELGKINVRGHLIKVCLDAPFKEEMHVRPSSTNFVLEYSRMNRLLLALKQN